MTKLPIAIQVGILALTPAIADAQEKFDCIIDPSKVLKVGSAAEGIVDQIFIARGDLVTKGDIIAKLEMSSELAALAYAKARADNEGPVEIAKSKVKIYQKKSDRAMQLGKQNIVANSAVEDALSELEVAELELRQAQLDKELAAYDLSRAEAQVERRIVRSPLDGIVISRMIGSGEYSYSQAPVAQLAKIDPLYVEVFLPARLYPDLKLEQKGEVIPAEPFGGSYQAKIIVKDRVFDAASDTFGVRLELPNPDGKIPAGLDCQVSF